MDNELNNSENPEIDSGAVTENSPEQTVTPSESVADNTEEQPVKAAKKSGIPKLNIKLPDNKFTRIVLWIWDKIKKFGLIIWDGLKHIPYCCYCLSHPFEGFFRMKEDKRKQSTCAGILLFIFLAISAIAKQQLTSVMFADKQAQLNLDVMSMVLTTVLPYILWVVSNWCFTSLMDGEGNLKDIFCATAAATIPMTVINIVLIPLSHLMTSDESNLYVFIGSLGTIITLIMMFLSMMSTQQYSLLKAIGTTILTIVGMAVIAFVVILIFYLVQQVWGFITSVFSEISYRINE